METFDFLCEVKSKINYLTVITILKLVIHLKAKTKLLTSGNCPHDKMTCRVKKKIQMLGLSTTMHILEYMSDCLLVWV